VVVAPLAVLLLGGIVVLAMTFLGVHQLRAEGTRAASEKAQVVATTVMARLSGVDEREATRLLQKTAHATESTLILAIPGGVRAASPAQPLSDNELSPLLSGPGGHRGAVRPDEVAFVALGPKKTRLIALVPEIPSAVPRGALVTSLVMFAALLLAAAAFVAWALARDVQADVLYVRRLIVNMAAEDAEPEGHLIPVRTIDQVGQLTASFNMLLDRFHAAERAYRADLAEADGFDRDRTAFLAALSHELRTPLNAILGFADVLLSEIDGPLSSEAEENLTVVRTSGEHLRSLIDDILTLSALESGEFRLSPEDLDIGQVAQDVVTEARVTAAQKGLAVELVRHEDTVALADRRRMRQVLGNVVGNAVKFTSSGSVKVEVKRDGLYVVTTVADTGPGIAEAAQERIFDEFEQSAAGTAQRTGTGLGLSITKRLVHLHGGDVKVESRLGEGSTFTIRIPVEPPTASFPKLLQGMRDPLILER
jgi:signal transduction histidine kinase